MSGFKAGFLWGGAVAAHQLEGGWREGRQGDQRGGCDDRRRPRRAAGNYRRRGGRENYPEP